MKHLKNLPFSLVAPLIIAVAGTGCPGHGQSPPATDADYAGSYTTEGVWNLANPFAGGRSLGDVAADLVVDEITQLAIDTGLPESLRDETRAAVAEVVYQPVQEYVDGEVPPELARSSEMLAELTAILSQVEVTTALVLDEDDGSGAVTGDETVTTLRLRHAGQTTPVAIEDVAAGVTIGGVVTGEVWTSTSLRFEPREFQLRVGPLVGLIVAELLGQDPVQLSDEAIASLACAALVARITDEMGNLSISVAGQTLSLDGDDLLVVCGDARDELDGRILGFIGPDTGVSVGGSVDLADDDDDGVVDRVASGPGYGGEMTLVPGPVVPRVDVSFTGVRQ